MRESHSRRFMESLGCGEGTADESNGVRPAFQQIREEKREQVARTPGIMESVFAAGVPASWSHHACGSRSLSWPSRRHRASRTVGREELQRSGQAVLSRHCLGCHSGEKPKGDFSLDGLAPNFTDDASRKRWQSVLSRVRSGEMPPKGKPRPPRKS